MDQLIEEFLSLGCKSRRDAAMCFQVYLDLCEVKRYWDVNYFYSEPLETMYITCKRSRSQPDLVYVPVFISESLSFSRMQALLSLATEESKIINIVIVSPDSTIVYYQIEMGIGAPLPETPIASRDEKREKIDAKLRKHRKLLEQSALYGVPITLPRKQQEKKATSKVKE